jgi:CMP-2-keto-3-deoxyoctulosonic acid synthetase
MVLHKQDNALVALSSEKPRERDKNFFVEKLYVWQHVNVFPYPSHSLSEFVEGI